MNAHAAPRLYLASKLHRAGWWREWKRELSPSMFNIVSTWHDNTTVEADEANTTACEDGWRDNRMQILHATDHMVVYGSKTDALNGTMIEIGMACAMAIPVHLVGTYPWGTWTHLPNVTVHPSLHHALSSIIGRPMHFPVKEHLSND